MRRILFACLLICAFVESLSTRAAIYMKIANIPGDVLATGFKDAIELSSLQFGIAEPISNISGGKTAAGPPQFSDINITKLTDIASTKLMTALATGTPQPTVIISLVTPSVDKLFTYCEITLSDVLFSSYSLSSGGDRPSESLSLHFSKIQVKYFVNSPTPPTIDPFIYDLTTVAP